MEPVLRNEIHVLFIESLDRFKVWDLCVLSGLHGYITGVQCSVVDNSQSQFIVTWFVYIHVYFSV